MTIKKQEGVIKGTYREILFDVSYNESFEYELVPVIFMHGFKGYKDWGAFNLVAKEFAKKGFLFIKFNFSFNGTTVEKPCDFSDLEAFGNNNFTRELTDLDRVLDYLINQYGNIINLDKLTLMAHSRGGATAIIKASEDLRVKKVVTWASVGTIEGRLPNLDLEEFKRTNVLYLPNARTNQNMPIYYQFVDDFYKNKERLELTKRAVTLDIPVLLIHGEMDTTVGLEEAKQLQKKISNSDLLILENGDHSFGAFEPWTDIELPMDLKEVVSESMKFAKT